MTPDDVAKSYDALADFWNGDRFPRENGIAQHERAIAFVDHRERAIDIGCGSSGRLLELFLAHGFQAEGLDLSERMLALARRRHPQLTFHHADVCRWRFPRKYDLISAWDSIWHVPLEQHEAVLRKLLEALTPGGVCIFTTGGLDSPSETWNSVMGPPMYHSAPGIPQVLRLIDDSGCICRHLEHDQRPELHVYVIAQRRVQA